MYVICKKIDSTEGVGDAVAESYRDEGMGTGGAGGLKREKLISSCVAEKKSSKETAQTAEI